MRPRSLHSVSDHGSALPRRAILFPLGEKPLFRDHPCHSVLNAENRLQQRQSSAGIAERPRLRKMPFSLPGRQLRHRSRYPLRCRKNSVPPVATRWIRARPSAGTVVPGSGLARRLLLRNLNLHRNLNRPSLPFRHPVRCPPLLPAPLSVPRAARPTLPEHGSAGPAEPRLARIRYPLPECSGTEPRRPGRQLRNPLLQESNEPAGHVAT